MDKNNNFIIIFLYIFLFFNIIYFVQSQLFEVTKGTIDVDIINIQDTKFSTYPTVTNSNQCTLDIKLLARLNSTFTQDFINDFNQTDGTKIIAKINDLDPNTKTIYLFSPSIPYGESTFQFTATSSLSSGSSVYLLKFNCNAINVSLIKIESSKRAGFLNEYMSYFYIDYFNHTFYSFKIIGSNNLISPIFGLKNLYIIIWDPLYVSENLLSTWIVSIDFNHTTLTVSSESYYQDSKQSEILPFSTNFESTPKQVLNNSNGGDYIFNEFGYGYSPIIILTFQTLFQRPFQFIFSKASTFKKYSIPIYGERGSLTYYLNLESFSQIGNPMDTKNYTLINQNHQDIYKLSFGFHIFRNLTLVPAVTGVTLVKNETLESFLITFENKYLFTDFSFTMGQKILKDIGFPFGFKNGDNNGFKFSAVFQKPMFSNSVSVSFIIHSTPTGTTSTEIGLELTSNDSPPILESYEFISVPSSTNIIFRFTVISNNGLDKIITPVLKGFESMIGGDIYNGTFEIIFPYIEEPTFSITLRDAYGFGMFYALGDVLYYDLKNNKLKFFELPPSSIKNQNLSISVKSFSNITFEINDMNLKDQDGCNVMYLQSNDIPINTPMKLIFLDPITYSKAFYSDSIGIGSTKNGFDILYNETSRLFTCRFILSKNNLFGEVLYGILVGSISTIVYSEFLPESARLRVNETYLDNIGPIFSVIEKIGENTIVDLNSQSATIGWRLTVTDGQNERGNGFESGYVKVMGTSDNSIYEFYLNHSNYEPGSTKWNSVYDLLIPVSIPCISQEYVITNVILKDLNQLESNYNIYSGRNIDINYYIVSNPFIKFYEQGNSNITRLSFMCNHPTASNDNDFVSLSYFATSKDSIDVGSNNASITFNFNVSSITGLRVDQTPIVYLLSKRMEIFQCKSIFKLVFSTIYAYECTAQLPIGFGYPGNLFLSVYGFIRNDGKFTGFSSNDLRDGGFQYKMTTTLSFNQPSIESTDRILSLGGDLVVYGRSLIDENRVMESAVLIKFTDNDLPDYIEVNPILIYSSIMVLKIRATSKPFLIKVIKNTMESNEYIVVPIEFKVSPTSPSNTIRPTSTPIPTVSPIPTNPPQKCFGNPECGGKNQGYCTLIGCICYSPFVGTGCDKKILITPPPVVNPSNPSSNLTGIPSSSNTNSEASLLVGIISIVSLRELDINKQVIKTFLFDKWEIKKLSENSNLYSTEIQFEKNDGDRSNPSCQINVKTDWYQETTNISFANQIILMNPSTLKYNINISSYAFDNQLNTLQLIFKAVAYDINKNENSCSSQKFGDTILDDSNYIQLSVNDHSLYGRFVKRAIIDGRVISVDNTVLYDLYNKDESTYYSSQSFIGIGIPNYKTTCILDPDFGLLIDSGTNNNVDDNEICNNESTLSRGALIGVVFGCIGGAIVIGVVIFCLIKYKYQLRNIKLPVALKKLK